MMTMNILRNLCGLAMLMLAAFTFAEGETPVDDTAGHAKMSSDDVIIRRSLVDAGNPTRLLNVFARARAGESIVVATIGGSITEGAGATSEENRWANRVAQWWRTTFPQSKVTFVNAGIGATGSDIGVHRAPDQLLKFKPDFVVVEFAVNDYGAPNCGETMEGLVRQILKQPNSPAVLLLFTTHSNGANTQDEHAAVGRHYGLPMVSYRDAIWPEVEAGHLTWQDISPDTVHPNDFGHMWCAKLITQYLDFALSYLPTEYTPRPVPELPAPLLTDVYEHVKMYDADSLKPTVNNGWTEVPGWRYGAGWQSDTPGSELVFEVEGRSVALVYFRLKGDWGMATAQVDDGPAVPLDGWFEADWGGYTAFKTIASGLVPGKHRLTIKLLDETNPASHGHQFQIHSIMTAGAE